MAIVLDTNVFVSRLLIKEGLPAQALDAWRDRRYLLVSSPAIISELQATLSYPRIRRKYAITDQDIAALCALLESDALLVSGDARVAGIVPDDPADERVLACALDVAPPWNRDSRATSFSRYVLYPRSTGIEIPARVPG